MSDFDDSSHRIVSPPDSATGQGPPRHPQSATCSSGETDSRLDSQAAGLREMEGRLRKAEEEIARFRRSIQRTQSTLLDCSRRIDTLSSSPWLFPVRNRLKRIAHKLTDGIESLAKEPAAAAIPRATNPFTDKQSTEYHRLKARWKKSATPHEVQQREWLEFRRQLFMDSGESARIEALAGRHSGKRCFILGNGPSLNRQDLSFLRDEITFVSNWFVNAEQYAAVDPKYYCVSSHEMFGGWNKPEPRLNVDFHRAMRDKARSAHKFFSFAFRDHIEHAGLFPGEPVNYLLFERPKRLVDETGGINLDLTRHLDDGYTVIQTMCIPLAAHFGCTTIYLLGCDCDYGINKEEDAKQYCYDSKLHTTTTTKFESLQRIWADGGPIFKSYDIVRETLEHRGVKLLNATHGGRLEVLPRADYRSLFP